MISPLIFTILLIAILIVKLYLDAQQEEDDGLSEFTRQKKKFISDDFKLFKVVSKKNIDGKCFYECRCYLCDCKIWVKRGNINMSFYRFCKECRTERNIEPPRKINHSDVCYFCDQRDPEMRRLNLDGAPVCIKCSMHYRRNLDDGEL